jgi:hypothetical protein
MRKKRTEADWLTAVFVATMLYILRERGLTSQRKLRLFAVACCRRLWTRLEDERSRQAVEVGEHYADGLMNVKELDPADTAAMSALDEICTARDYDIRIVLSHAPFGFPRNAPAAIRWACAAAWTVAENAERAAWTAEGVATTKELAAHCGFLRDIFGNPFRPVSLDSAWQTRTVVGLAHAAYDERFLPAGTLDPARLAVLADALEDAGCTEAAILDHCRGPGPHVRGCWVLDLLLGKQ